MMRHSQTLPTLATYKKNIDQMKGDEDRYIQQTIELVKNPKSRGSTKTYTAFPEHKSKVKKTEPEDVLLITRIHIDKHGEKKSVAVAVLPPPPGEEFEGGYKIER